MSVSLVAGITCFFTITAGISGVHAATLTVNNTTDSGAGSLRQALADAVDGDTIQFAPALNGQTIVLTTAELAIDKNITITGPGPDQLAVERSFSAAAQFRIFHILPGHVVLIAGLEISRGSLPETDAGGGVRNDQSTLTLNNCAVLDCLVGTFSGGLGTGGGIYNNNGTLEINGSSISGNFATAACGGIYNTAGGTLKIRDSVVSWNSVRVQFMNPPQFVGRCGGISNAGTAEITNCTIENNTGGQRGGGIESGGSLTIANSIISGNSVLFAGGGINNGGPLTISNSTISGNAARFKGFGNGGGIYTGGGGATVTISNSTISGNVVTNPQGQGGGIYVAGGTLELENTILNAGAVGANIFYNSGTVISHGYNLSSDDGGGFLTATGDQINTDPMLGPLQNNSGPTFTHALLAGSPAINAGDPNFVLPPFYDQRGPNYGRVFNGRIDIGSFEVQPTPIPFLGNYPDRTVALSGNTTVIPDAPANDATSIHVSTNTNFQGTFVADRTTGVVRVTNAHPAGNYLVTVKVSNAAGTNSKTFILTVISGTECNLTVQFTNTALVGTGDAPQSVAIGDFNNDGNQDLAIANRFSNSVSIRLGNGLGGFTGTTEVTLPGNAWSVAIGDFNNDGNQDLACANGSHPGSVSIRLGDGLGGFNAAADANSSENPSHVAVGDFNNDGNQDLACANANYPGSVSIRLGDGLGGFTGAPDVGVGFLPQSLAIGDFDNNGNQDFACANFSSNSVSVHLGDGLGGFSQSATVGTTFPFSVAIGDFNRDGNQDFLAVNTTVSVYLGNGVGGFHGSTNVSVDDYGLDVAVGDFNNDDKEDFATANFRANTVSIRFGNGSGGFGGSTNVNVGVNPHSIAIGDFNNDGRQDFATADQGSDAVSIRLGVCAEAPSPTPTPTATPTVTPTATPTASPTATATPPTTPTPSPTAAPSSTPTQALNISTRLRVETGDRIMIGGFIITGSASKKVAIRGIGPSLANSGLSDVLADPTLELRGSTGALLAQNDNWQDNSAQAADLIALGLAPQHPNEAGIVATLEPGAYTAIVAGKNQTTGLGLVEIYDADAAAASQLANISTRGFVQTGDNVMIGGFILGNSGTNTNIIVRGIGPSLDQFGLNNVLPDPTLELRDSNGTLLIANDNWQDDPVSAAQLTARGLALPRSEESGVFVSLPPGAFTAIVAGKNGGVGVGLVEVYNVQ